MKIKERIQAEGQRIKELQTLIEYFKNEKLNQLRILFEELKFLDIFLGFKFLFLT